MAKVASPAAAALLLLLLLSLLCCCIGAQVFDITKYGAIGDGKTWNNKALWSAFHDACKSTTPSQVLIPNGTFVLGELKMAGPCMAPIEFNLQGTLNAIKDPFFYKNGDGWVIFSHIDRLTLTGGGIFDGQGKTAWSLDACSKKHNCRIIPNIRFNSVTNAVVSNITTLNSKNFHVVLNGCKNIDFQYVTIRAPSNSPNTDGIHIGQSVGINITDSEIKTGDDCISLGDGSRDVFATRVQCGPGHGFSVGSLGKFPDEEPVVGFTVKNCTFVRTQNGIRIKTWPASYPNTVSNVYVEDVYMVRVDNPIIIDQVYCPWNRCNPKIPSEVQIKNVTLTNIWGTSGKPVAVKLNCSSKVPCQDIRLSDIKLYLFSRRKSTGRTTSSCAYVDPSCSGDLVPPICSSV